jgi:hypothetical protein
MAERAGTMPIGHQLQTPIRAEQATTTEGNVEAPQFMDQAAATIVWENYQKAKGYVENNAWLLEWQETDILYQSPIPNRFQRVEQGRPPRVSRFLVAKFTRTLARAIKRGLFAEQYPFFLRATGKTTTQQIDAWSALIGKLLKRMNFKYHSGLAINCQTLQGTCIVKVGCEVRERVKKRRVRKSQPIKAEMPAGNSQEVPTVESDDFELKPETVTESWPFIEYRRLGTTLFDEKWCTPDKPDESAGYVIDVDYVNFGDLQEMRQLACYKNIPDEETLKQYFFQRQEGSAAPGSSVEQSMSSQGSMVTHASERNKTTDANPLNAPLLLIEQWDTRTTKTLLVYEGRMLLIRNEDHDWDSSLHFTATWWPIDNCGYGMGTGRLTGADQRINQGVTNEALKMIAYPFNAPILVARGENSPTQNTIARMGGYQQVDVPIGGDVRKAMAFMEMPPVPNDAWRMLEASQHGGEDLVGASPQMQQGNVGSPGSSVVRTATGANRVAGMSDQNVADPIESFSEGVIIPTIEFLVQWVKEKMPMREIREILSAAHAKVIEDTLAEDSFIEAQFEVDVLAGAKLAARQGIAQLIPFFLQIVQQPQLMEYLHQRGWTIDFKVIADLFMQVSELTQQGDIFRMLTPEEMKTVQAMNPSLQKVKGQVAVEQVRGQNKQAEIKTKGDVDLANKGAEIAMEHVAGATPLVRAEGLLERSSDTNTLQNGLPDTMQQ